MSDTSGFARFVPGFEFLQNLAGQASSGMAQGLGQGMPQMPNLGNWVAPTFSVEELDKRITELKAVQFWLDQNAKALAATIQALEVQKMTLAALQQMNVSLGDVANAFQVKPASHEAPAPAAPPAPAPEAPEPAAAPEPPPPEDSPAAPRKTRGKGKPASAARAGGAPGGIDPVAWWGALSQQFQQIANSAMQDMARQGTPVPAAAPAAPAGATRKKAAPRTAPARTRRAPAPAPAAKKPRAKPTRR